MPTDENNWVTPQQNQLGNPNLQWNWNPVNQNLWVSNDNFWDSDDFDFNFNDSWNSVVDSVDSQVLQNQVENEWRTGMFKTPDEELNVQQQDNPVDNPVSYSWNSDINTSTTETVGVSANTDTSVSVSNDTNSNVNIGEDVNVDTDTGGKWNIVDEDSYLADIDPGDVQSDDNSNDVQQNLFDQDDTSSQENLSEEIQSMISFDEDPSVDVAEKLDKSDDSASSSSDSTVNSFNSSDDLSTGWDSNSDDWLAAEDKEVEESFWVQDVAQPNEPDVNMSSQDVAQNVENLITNSDEVPQQNNTQYVPDENEYSKMSNLLNSSSTWQVDLNNIDMNNQSVVSNENLQVESDMSSLEWSSMVQETNASAMFSQVGWMDTQIQNNDQNMGWETSNEWFGVSLNGPDLWIQSTWNNDIQSQWNNGAVSNDQSSGWEINNVWFGVPLNNPDLWMQDMWNNDIQSQWNDGVVNNDQNIGWEIGNAWFGVSLNGSDLWTQNVWNNDIQNQLNNTSTNDYNVWTTGTFNVDVNTWWNEQSIGFGLGALNATDESWNTTELWNTMEWWSSAEVWNSSFNLDTLIDQDIENLSNVNNLQDLNSMNLENSWNLWYVQWQSDMQNGQVVQQNVPVKKRKKQSWFKVLWIFLWVVVALCVLWFAASKMFPDKVNLDNIFKWSKVLEYLDNSWIVGDLWISDSTLDENSEWNEDQQTEEWIENINWEEDLWEDNVWEWENWEENLWEGEGWEEGELDPNSLAALLADEDSDSIWSDSENSGDASEVLGDNTSDTQDESNDSSFDPFAEVDELFDENKKNSDALKNYISQWEFYKNLWTSKSNTLMLKYWEYIMVKAQTELTKLENWEEIDTTLFTELDEVLERAENLTK